MKNILIKIVCFLSLFTILFTMVSNFFVVNEHASIANIEGFYLEKKNSMDVALIGPSEFYTGYSAPLAWKDYGYSSYSLAVSAAPGNLYKSMLDEVMNRQNPQLIVFEINGFLQKDDTYNDYGAIHTWLDNIPLSRNKIQTINEIVPKDMRAQFLFKMDKYHGNWKSPISCAKMAAIKARLNMTGYTYTKGLATFSICNNGANKKEPQPIYFTEKSEQYLRELLEECKKREVKNVLFLRLPHQRYFSNPKELDKIESIIDEYGYSFLNLNEAYEETGVNLDEDFIDAEHLNVRGMRKVTSYLGKYFVDTFDITTNHSEKEKEQWNQCVEKTEKLIGDCEKDIQQKNELRYYEFSVYCKPQP